MADQILNKTISPDAPSDAYSIITMDQTGTGTVAFENPTNTVVADDITTLTLDATADSYSLISIDQIAAGTDVLENPTWNYAFVGQIIYNVYGRVNRRTGFQIISSTLNPMIWHDITTNNPHAWHPRTDTYPFVYHSGLPFSTTNITEEVAMANPTNNDDANENAKTIGSSKTTASITIDKTDAETATMTTSFNYTVA